jgi:hypothetical protein
MKTVILILSIFLGAFMINAQTWSTDFKGIDSLWNPLGGHGEVFSMHNYKDSILFIGGTFKNVNNEIDVNSIISWNGDTISRFENGLDQWAIVNDILFYKGKMFVGDYFWSASDHPNTKNIAIWNGSTWEGTSIGQPTSDVHEFALFQGNLIVGGNFEHFGTTPLGRIALFDGTNWHNIGFFGMWIKALAEFNGELYAGGYHGLRKYLGGTSWEYLPIQPIGDNGWISEFQVDSFNTFLYVGGQFMEVAGQSSIGIAMWDGFNWNAISGFNNMFIAPQAMKLFQNDLYAGCHYDLINGAYSFRLGRWNGTHWDSIGGNFNDAIHAMEIFRDTIYIGGTFSKFNGERSKGLVKLAMPDNGCNYIKPRINTLSDTFYLNNGFVNVQFYNNNPYVNNWQWDFGDLSTASVQNPEHTFTDTGTYTVSVTVAHEGCVKTAEKQVTILNPVGISSLDIQHTVFKIYPNPTDNQLTIETQIPQRN